jgi:hypothetical protein
LLDKAVDVDPPNAAARYAYAVHRDRLVAAPDKQRKFAEDMWFQYQSLPPVRRGYEPLELRILYSRAASWRNIVLLGGGAPPVEDTREAKRAAELLVHYVDRYARGPRRWFRPNKPRKDTPLQAFAKDMRVPAAYLGLGAGLASKPVQEWRDLEPVSFSGRYARACYHAERGDTTEALRHLEIAAGRPDLRDWAPEDPSFACLRRNKTFKELVGTPAPSSFVELKPFAAKKDALAELEVSGPDRMLELTEEPADRQDLADALGVQPLTVTTWRDVAELATMHEDLEDLSMLDLLLSVGITSPAALAERAAEVEALVDQLAAAAQRRAVVAPEASEIMTWLGC